jgi:uncharacterized protein (DUF983 family)
MPETKKKKRFYLWSVFTNRCPRCREGKLFLESNAYNLKRNVLMHEHCPVCGQPTEIEVGFYYGTGYVSYAVSIAFLVTTFVAWKLLIGVTFSIDDNRIFYWMGIAFTLLFAMQPLIMRLSRILWLSWFVSYDPNWKEHQAEHPERIVPEQMNNW